MALTYKDFGQRLYNAAEKISLQFGNDLRQSDLSLRATVATVCVLIGGVLRVLTFKGVATDAEIGQQFTAIQNDTYPRLPITPAVIDENNQNPPPPDLTGTAPTA